MTPNFSPPATSSDSLTSEPASGTWQPQTEQEEDEALTLLEQLLDRLEQMPPEGRQALLDELPPDLRAAIGLPGTSSGA